MYRILQLLTQCHNNKLYWKEISSNYVWFTFVISNIGFINLRIFWIPVWKSDSSLFKFEFDFETDNIQYRSYLAGADHRHVWPELYIIKDLLTRWDLVVENYFSSNKLDHYNFHIDVTFEMRTVIKSNAFIQLIITHTIRLSFMWKRKRGQEGKIAERQRERESEGERTGVGEWQM